MIKTINIQLQEDEFEELNRLKIEFGFNSWKELLISLVNVRNKTLEISNKYVGEIING